MSLITEALIITRRSQKIATCSPTLSEPLSQQDVRCLGVGSALGRSTNQSALRRARWSGRHWQRGWEIDARKRLHCLKYLAALSLRCAKPRQKYSVEAQRKAAVEDQP